MFQIFGLFTSREAEAQYKLEASKKELRGKIDTLQQRKAEYDSKMQDFRNKSDETANDIQATNWELEQIETNEPVERMALTRLLVFWKEPNVMSVHDMVYCKGDEATMKENLKRLLRPGDILKLPGAGSLARLAPHAPGDREALGYDHYYIYHSLGDDGNHYIIEKLDKGQNNRCVVFDHVSSQHLWNSKLLMNCRFPDTLATAQFLFDNDLDNGFDLKRSNCEHFVVFCMTRDTKYCASKQVPASELRDKPITYKPGKIFIGPQGTRSKCGFQVGDLQSLLPRRN